MYFMNSDTLFLFLHHPSEEATLAAGAGRHSRQPSGRTESPVAAPRYLAVKRIGLASATTLVSVNVWTGAPLLAIWAGSQLPSGTTLSMGAVVAVVLVLVGLEMLLLRALTWMSARDDQLVGRPAPGRRTYPWNASLRAEREQVVQQRQGVNSTERIMILSVVSGAIAFEAWFFFLAGSSLPSG
jgi:hypothetical protein